MTLDVWVPKRNPLWYPGNPLRDVTGRPLPYTLDDIAGRPLEPSEHAALLTEIRRASKFGRGARLGRGVKVGKTAVSYSPLDEGNGVFWLDMLDPTSFVESAGAMVSITNKVSSVVWNTALSALPSYSATAINSLPGMVFNGTSHAIGSTEAAVVAAFTDSPARTSYAIASADLADPVSFRTIFGFGNSGQASASSGGVGQADTGTGRWVIFARNAANTVINNESTGASDANSNVFSFINSTTTATIRINNGTADPNGGSASYSTTTPDRVCIGGLPRATTTLRWDGEEGEILIFTAEHDGAAQSRVTAYLGTRWSITVAP